MVLPIKGANKFFVHFRIAVHSFKTGGTTTAAITAYPVILANQILTGICITGIKHNQCRTHEEEQDGAKNQWYPSHFSIIGNKHK